ncbi:M23 family metallopeptidase [Halioxenophilus sp. WMMB6]|uniref:M23 family metallopeptidase n=1 Tax=Halioxenophilus sp. WMMB6 TaxID=3073815 RepID=UPI00295E692B|nr:M23 family metallopeptidase [Halioxenophilus sp. WMMB6]
MKIIVIGKGHSGTKTYTLSGWTKAVLSLCLLGLPLGVGTSVGALFASQHNSDFVDSDTAQAWQASLQEQELAIKDSKREAEQQLSALTLRVAELQARLLRIDALGERLTTAADLDAGEFDFSQAPALGGPENSSESISFDPPSFIDVIDELAAQIEDRQQQLDTLEALMANRKIQNDVFIAGRPIKKGWISSFYGRRTDPFNGHLAWHSGMDFAGQLNSDVVAVASGVVTWSGDRYGYGQMVEINHGSGFSTRYAHNSENLVAVGDVVKKGQIVALMGSSGRSTGPHVHFEVYKNGRPVDPSSYIHRTPRK